MNLDFGLFLCLCGTVASVIGQIQLPLEEMLKESPATFHLSSLGRSTTHVLVKEEEMGSCGVVPLPAMMMIRNGAFVLIRVSKVN